MLSTKAQSVSFRLASKAAGFCEVAATVAGTWLGIEYAPAVKLLLRHSWAQVDQTAQGGSQGRDES